MLLGQSQPAFPKLSHVFTFSLQSLMLTFSPSVPSCSPPPLCPKWFCTFTPNFSPPHSFFTHITQHAHSKIYFHLQIHALDLLHPRVSSFLGTSVYRCFCAHQAWNVPPSHPRSSRMTGEVFPVMTSGQDADECMSEEALDTWLHLPGDVPLTVLPFRGLMGPERGFPCCSHGHCTNSWYTVQRAHDSCCLRGKCSWPGRSLPKENCLLFPNSG